MAATTSRRCIDPALSTNAVLTALAAETAFALNLPISAGELRKSHKLTFGATVKNIAANSTDTFRLRLYLGTAADATGILLADTGAVDGTADDVMGVSGWGQVRTYGAASAGILTGIAIGVPKTAGTGVFTTFGAVEAQLDFTAAQYLTATITHSANSAGNQSRLEALWLEIAPMAH